MATLQHFKRWCVLDKGFCLPCVKSGSRILSLQHAVNAAFSMWCGCLCSGSLWLVIQGLQVQIGYVWHLWKRSTTLGCHETEFGTCTSLEVNWKSCDVLPLLPETVYAVSIEGPKNEFLPIWAITDFYIVQCDWRFLGFVAVNTSGVCSNWCLKISDTDVATSNNHCHLCSGTSCLMTVKSMRQLARGHSGFPLLADYLFLSDRIYISF